MCRLVKNKKKNENPLLNLLANVVAPAVILSKFSEEARLGPQWALVLALSIPVGYWVFDYFKRRKSNFLSILGFVSVLLTGGLGLLALDGFWFAVKEAIIPLGIGIVTLVSLKTRYPVVKMLVYNDSLMDIQKVDHELSQRGHILSFNRLLLNTTLMLAVSFFLSAALNFFLAIYLLTAQSGTPEFNEQLAKMTALSYPVIVVPCTIMMIFAVWYLLRGIRKLTGLTMEQIFNPKHDTISK